MFFRLHTAKLQGYLLFALISTGIVAATTGINAILSWSSDKARVRLNYIPNVKSVLKKETTGTGASERSVRR